MINKPDFILGSDRTKIAIDTIVRCSADRSILTSEVKLVQTEIGSTLKHGGNRMGGAGHVRARAFVVKVATG